MHFPLRCLCGLAVAVSCALPASAQTAGNTIVYRCPGPPVLYTDSISSAEAKEKGCRTIEAAPVTVIQGQRPRNGTPVPAASGPRPADAVKIDPSQQRARDSDARRILQDELKKEEDALAALKKDYNDGQPERRGDERNYQKYLDRVADMKAAIARKEADIAAIKREIGKLGP